MAHSLVKKHSSMPSRNTCSSDNSYSAILREKPVSSVEYFYDNINQQKQNRHHHHHYPPNNEHLNEILHDNGYHKQKRFHSSVVQQRYSPPKYNNNRSLDIGDHSKNTTCSEEYFNHKTKTYFRTRCDSEPTDIIHRTTDINFHKQLDDNHRCNGKKLLPPTQTPPIPLPKNNHYEQSSSTIKVTTPRVLIYNKTQRAPNILNNKISSANLKTSNYNNNKNRLGSTSANIIKPSLHYNKNRFCSSSPPAGQLHLTNRISKSSSPTFDRNRTDKIYNTTTTEKKTSDNLFTSIISQPASIVRTSVKLKSTLKPSLVKTSSSTTKTIAVLPIQNLINGNDEIQPDKSPQKLIGKKKLTKKNVESTLSDSNDDDDDAEEECSSLEDDDDFENISDDDDILESSSDSDDGYKRNAYYSQLDISVPPSQILTLTRTIPETPKSLLSPSLFPNVPPYLSFSTNNEKGPLVAPEIHKILKWKQTKVMPRVVRHTLTNSGCRLLRKTNDWMGTWGKHMKSPCFRAIRPHQKINHLPGSFAIGRKDSCWKKIRKQMLKYGKKEFGFMPKTFIIPQDLKLLKKSWPKYCERNAKWIIKPPASARGTGIKVVSMWCQIPKRKPIIVQRYIERPLLINGSKFDLRLYVLVTSINPLRVFMYNDGLARFASVKYSQKVETLNDRCMHLTNYSINKKSSNYSKNEDANACRGHKWTVKSLLAFLATKNIDVVRLWQAIQNLVLRTIFAGENCINSMISLNVESRYSCFELFGFDILLDSELVPWLLEVNISPSLHSDSPLDLHVKAPLIQAVLNTALYHIPPKLSAEKQKEICAKEGLKSPLCYDKRMYVTYLSRAEKVKHTQFTRKSLEDRDDYINGILKHLTPDDIRCLITCEDELARCAPLERIFPTNKTYKFLKYTENQRYYNRLLDSWENRYGHNRTEGINHLIGMCRQNYHLDVSPQPLQRQLKTRTRTMKKWALLSSKTGRNLSKETMEKMKRCKKLNHSTTQQIPNVERTKNAEVEIEENCEEEK